MDKQIDNFSPIIRKQFNDIFFSSRGEILKSNETVDIWIWQ